MEVSYETSQMMVMILAILGLGISLYIYAHKLSGRKHMVCPMNMKCDEVVGSAYSRTFGIPNELGGIIYYAGMAILAGLFSFSHFFVPLFWKHIQVYASILAFLFSIYLLSVQAFKIKHWCSWCLASAIISALIFVIIFFF